MGQSQSIQDVVAATLAEMGLCSAPAALLHTVLIHDRYFVGHKYRFDGGYAVWLVQTNVIEIYGDDGKLLKTLTLEATERGTAA